MKRSPSASGAAGRPARDVVAVVVEDFRARPARAGVAHLPEIVGAGDADDPGVRQARDLLPQVERLIVVDIDRGRQPVLRQAEFLGDQVPGQLDGAVLEIVAEREVAEHLEERVVARGVADVVEVVVLAAGAHAFLRGHGALVGALLEAGEDVLELHHAGVGEHQRRVVARHQRRRRHDLVAGLGEIVEKARPDVVDAAHFRRRLTFAAALPRRPKSPGRPGLQIHAVLAAAAMRVQKMRQSPLPLVGSPAGSNLPKDPGNRSVQKSPGWPFKAPVGAKIVARIWASAMTRRTASAPMPRHMWISRQRSACGNLWTI